MQLTFFKKLRFLLRFAFLMIFAFAAFAQSMKEETTRIDVTVKDLNGRQETKPVLLTIYRPEADGVYPLIIFNHGRAVAYRRASQGPSKPVVFARHMIARGFVVIAPTRIGYHETYGSFDPESVGSCNNMQIEPMSIAASDQVLATYEFAKTLPYVDASKWIVAGQSVGGLTSVAAVGRKPSNLLGGINFSGGMGGDPDRFPEQPCNPMAITNYWGKIAPTSIAPMLWLYWENDKFWGAEIPKTWHQAWVKNGGKATMHTLPPSGQNGHSGIDRDVDTWLPIVDNFLNQLMPKK